MAAAALLLDLAAQVAVVLAAHVEHVLVHERVGHAQRIEQHGLAREQLLPRGVVGHVERERLAHQPVLRARVLVTREHFADVGERARAARVGIVEQHARRRRQVVEDRLDVVVQERLEILDAGRQRPRVNASATV